MQSAGQCDSAFSSAEGDAQTRVANEDEANRAMTLGEVYLKQREYERAVRLLRKSWMLKADSRCALLLQQAMAEARSDPRYCSSCYRFTGNCVCGESSSNSSARVSDTNDAGHAQRQSVAGRQPSLTAYLWDHWSRTMRFLGSAPAYDSSLAALACLIVMLVFVRAAGGPLLSAARPSSASVQPTTVYRPWDYSYVSPGGGFAVYAPIGSFLMVTGLINVGLWFMSSVWESGRCSILMAGSCISVALASTTAVLVAYATSTALQRRLGY